MKRKYLLVVTTLLVLASCSSPKKKTTSSAIQPESSSLTTSVVPSSSSSITSQPTSNTSVTTSASSGTSTTPPSSSSSIPIPPVNTFGFDDEEITIDLKVTTSIDLSAKYSNEPDEDIVWTFDHSNCLRAGKTITKHNQVNHFEFLNVGDTKIHVDSDGEHDDLVVHVVNTTSKPVSGTQAISLYAVNDYHGSVSGTFDLAHFGTFIKQKVSLENTLFLDQGDTWQGSLKSNYNRGRMITDVYNAAGMSSRTVGNHDFDWGQDKIETNKDASYHGYSTPVLAANIYDYNFNTHQVGSTQQSHLGQEYTTFTLESGIKVGVIGVIGETIEREICTPNVMDVEFISMPQVIKNCSDTLRVNEHCDIVVASIHEEFQSSYAEEITSISPQSGKKYVDAVLNGHSHQVDTYELNGVPFVQFGSYNQCIGKLNLIYDYANGTIANYSRYALDTSSLIEDVPSVDPEIQSIVDQYNNESSPAGNVMLTENFNGTFDRYGEMPNLVCTAAYQAARAQGYDVSYAICNSTRQSLSGPEVTYESLFNALPFDNVIYIIEISGEDMYYRFVDTKWWYFYRGNNAEASAAISSSKEKYTVACIDYVALHCNASRYYDYFPSAKIVGYLTKNGDVYNYRDVTADYLKSIDGSILPSSYSSSLIQHDYSMVTSPLP